MKEIYQVLAGAMGRERNLDQIANNLANVNTTGFKKDGAAFVDYFQAQLAATQAAAGTAAAAGSVKNSDRVWPQLASPYTNFSAGSMQNTGQPLDLAIDGDAFFQVEVPGQPGPFYTRAGNFGMNAEGELITADGRRVLSAGGSAITFARTGDPISITKEGDVFEGPTSLGKLALLEFDDPGQLRKHGESLFTAPAGVQGQEATQSEVRQGVLEGSNVNPIEELVAMIRTERAYQTDQKVLQSIDELTSKRIDATMNR